jgi:hypothetical protein
MTIRNTFRLLAQRRLRYGKVLSCGTLMDRRTNNNGRIGGRHQTKNY